MKTSIHTSRMGQLRRSGPQRTWNLGVLLRQLFDPEHRYLHAVKRYLNRELDVIRNNKRIHGHNTELVLVQIVAPARPHKYDEYILLKTMNGSWVQVMVHFDHGYRHLKSAALLDECSARSELKDHPEIYQLHFGDVEDA